MAGSLWGNISAVLYFIYFQLAGLAAAHILLKEESRPVRLAVGSAAGSLMLHLLPSLGAIALDFTVAGTWPMRSADGWVEKRWFL